MAMIRTVICKAPQDLDFDKFLHVIDHNARNNLLRRQPKFLPSLFLYSSVKQAVNVYYLVNIDHFAQNVTDSFFQIIKEIPHNYNVMIFEGWSTEKSLLEGYQYGDISKLPTEKKKEQLIVEGKSRDGERARTVIYDIIRLL